MKHCKYLFIAYAIAILSSVGANGATVTGLATPEYVKGAINSLPAVARSGSYNDLSNKPTIPAAQVNSDWNATSGKAQILNKPTLGAMAAKANVTNADISGTIDQGKITGLTTALAGKQPTLTTGDTGNIKGTGSVTVTKDATTGVITVNGTDTKYTLPAANGSTRGGVVTGGDITATNGTLTITDGKVTSAKIANGTIVNADISDSAAIAVSKISGAQTTGNIVNPDSDGNFVAADKTSTTKYPSMAAAQQIATAVAATQVSTVTSRVNALETDLDALSATVEANKGAAEGAIAALDSSVSNANGAISTITITDGKITNVTRKSVSTNDLAADAVTNAKLANDAVQTENIKAGAVTAAKTSGVIGQIPSGSATSTTYAQIWVQ